MISVQDAFSVLQDMVRVMPPIDLPLAQARKHVLSETVFSTINMPPFRQSAMDGFAVALHDSLTYEIIGEIKAGDGHQVALLAGQAVKIFTGAAVPDSAQAVIQIEKVTAANGVLQLQETPRMAQNIRPIGEQIAAGDLALTKGTLLNAAAIGFLAGLGFTSVEVFQKPKVGIVVTGNELSKPGTPLEYGKVYESNGIMLATALQDAFIENTTLYEVNDDFENTKNTLEEALTVNDVVLVSGGISVGDYDFVAQALRELQVATLFYKVNQKPGKPLFAGKLEDKIVFALPGNPAACMTCFYVYVLPTLAVLSGQKANYNQSVFLPLAHDYSVHNSRCQFLKATITGNIASVLSHQASSMLNSFAIASGLIYVPNGTYELKKGDAVAVYLVL
ncbi:molybdopterin molybdotransferase MoeA [Flavobacterium restrictum]|uniref:Molybdopterin molybdenumtransferase n=1 Tax=Flavobacterium restrictum TaxID=2594428 RepID=A0A553E957_9FLAO|nr:gephyrin-like molybdotransferase Glp [Flavobacterium restrictum]TRX41515.1 molybdopterin molybdotransferase MoeA [Flavobacterium restrictum]